jgi:hypothetical protein
MRPAIRFAIAWFALASLFAVGLWQLNIPTFLRLLRHGERTNATVVKLDCGNHARALYGFTVGSAHYSNSDTMHAGCDLLHPGDTIAIYYDVTDPTISRASEPKAALENELITIASVCIFVPPLIIASAMAWYKKKATMPSD